MKETSKACRRRCAETSEQKFDWDKVFKGAGIDIGSGDDPLPGALPFDLPDGGGDDILDFFPGKENHFDYVHASQVIEHLNDPVIGLRSWIAITKPGGFVCVTCPDYALYEKFKWPSVWNQGHRTAWTMDANIAFDAIRKDVPINLLPDWLNQFLNTEQPCEILLCQLVDTSDHSLPEDVDQTLPEDGAEVFIEFVLHRISGGTHPHEKLSFVPIVERSKNHIVLGDTNLQ